MLPGCEVLEAATAARLTEFVDAGGTLVAVGALPARAAGDDDGAVAALAARFAAGAARARRDAGRARRGARRRPERRRRRRSRRCCGATASAPCCSCPAVYPRATEIESPATPTTWHSWTGGCATASTAARAPARSTSSSRGVSGDARAVGAVLRRAAPRRGRAGRRRRPRAGHASRTGRARCSCGAAPATSAAAAEPRARDHARRTVGGRAGGDAGGRLGRPRRARGRRRDLGARAPRRTARRSGRRCTRRSAPARAGPGRRRTTTCRAARGMPASGPPRGRRRAASTRTRARRLPRAAAAACPRSSCDFGPVGAGEAVRLRAVIAAPSARVAHLTSRSARRPPSAPGSTAARSRSTAAATWPWARWSWRPGESVLDLRLTRARGRRRAARRTSRSSPTSRATRARSSCAPPAGRQELGRGVLARASRCRREPTTAEVLVGANGPCRVLVDGVEVGRQGGFDPYAELDKDRLQPYDLAEHLRAGRARAAPRAARRSAAPGRPRCSTGSSRPRPAPCGCVGRPTGRRRRDGADRPIDLRLDQHGDPAYNHAWKRPHPLPDGAWLEPGRAQRGRGRARHRHRRTARSSRSGCASDRPAGRALEIRSRWRPAAAPRSATPPERGTLGRRRRARRAHGRRRSRSWSSPRPACTGGALLTGPGGVHGRPRRDGARRLAGRGPAEPQRRRPLPPAARAPRRRACSTSARSAARRRCSSTARAPACASARRTRSTSARGRTAGATLEILVLNTLGPHLDAVSPTPYVFAGQRRSGLFGPVRMLTWSATGPGPMTSTVVPSGAGSSSPMSSRNGGYSSVIRVA